MVLSNTEKFEHAIRYFIALITEEEGVMMMVMMMAVVLMMAMVRWR